MKSWKKALWSAAAVLICCAAWVLPEVHAETTASVGDFQITGNPAAYSYSGGTLTISGSDALTIQNTEPGTATSDHILITGASAYLTFAGVNIDVSAMADTAAVAVARNDTDVTVNLMPGKQNDLYSGANCAGIQKKGGGQGGLVINGENSSILNVTGGSDGSGIGGGKTTSGSTEERVISHITINGGHIVAYAGAGGNGAGIGGLEAAYITINGGFVDANATGTGAGIGGAGGDGHDITINEGTVYAWAGDYTGSDMGNGAGIGGGSTGDGYNISITGGSVKACGGGIGGAGIGSGGTFGLSAYNISISGGTVQALSYTNAPGIGSGSYDEGSCYNITISGGTVTAKCQLINSGSANGIGTTNGANVSDIVISGGSISAQGFGGMDNFGTAPQSTSGAPVYQVSLGIADISAQKAVTNITTELNGTSETKAMKMFTCDTGDGVQRCFVYLPENTIVHSVVIDGDPYINLDVAPIQAKIDRTGSGTLKNINLASGDFSVTGGVYNTDYTFDTVNRILHIETSTSMEITNRVNGATTDRIVVDTGVAADLTLSGIHIDVSSTPGAAAFEIADTSAQAVALHLKDGTTNQFNSGSSSAALQKNGSGALILDGDGILLAYGGENGAGIGGSTGASSDHITIEGGTILAAGGRNADGIGNGNAAVTQPSDIVITGGSVRAYSTKDGTGISCTPKNAGGTDLYPAALCLPAANGQALYIRDIKQEGTTVPYSSSALYTLAGTSGAAADGWLYLWLPSQQTAEETSVTLAASRKVYTYSGTIKADASSRLKMKQTDFTLSYTDTLPPVYGNTFRVSASGGSGDGTISYSTVSPCIRLNPADGTGTFTSTGSYTILAEKPGNDYYWDASSELKGNVAQRPVRLTWTGAGTRIYDGSNSKVSAAIANIVGTDEVNIVITGGEEKAVGRHIAMAAALTGRDKALYTLTGSNRAVTYEITAAGADNSGQSGTPGHSSGSQTANITKSARTGDTAQTLFWLLLAVMAAGVLGVRLWCGRTNK